MLMAAQGLENKAIASRLDLPFPVVSKWRRRSFEERLGGLEERSRTGRTPVFPPKVVVVVRAIACELPSRLGFPSRASRSPTSEPRWPAADSWPASPVPPSGQDGKAEVALS